MKKLTAVAALALAMAASASQAGSMSDPIIEQDLIIADAKASSSSGKMQVALLALLLAVPAIAN